MVEIFLTTHEGGPEVGALPLSKTATKVHRRLRKASDSSASEHSACTQRPLCIAIVLEIPGSVWWPDDEVIRARWNRRYVSLDVKTPVLDPVSTDDDAIAVIERRLSDSIRQAARVLLKRGQKFDVEAALAMVRRACHAARQDAY